MLNQGSTLSYRPVLTAAFVLFSFTASPGPGSATELDCDLAVPVDVGTTLRGARIDSGEDRIFSLDVPTAGIVMLDAFAPSGAPGLPYLRLLEGGCGGTDGRFKAQVAVERTSGHLMTFLPAAGRYYFRLTSQDPRGSLKDYKLSTRFMAADADSLITATPEEEEEVDPNPISPPALTSTGNGLLFVPPEEEEEVDPNPISPPALTSTGNGLLFDPGSHLAPVCGATDDHAESIRCATFLGADRQLAGTIDNDWGDDDDMFIFVLENLMTIAVATTGTTDTFGELYDRFGHRLALDDDGGDSSNFRIVRTLAPGRYFVRVAGSQRSEGPYQVGVELLDW